MKDRGAHLYTKNRETTIYSKVNIIINTDDRHIDIRNGKDFSLLTSKQSIKKYLADLLEAGIIESI